MKTFCANCFFSSPIFGAGSYCLQRHEAVNENARCELFKHRDPSASPEPAVPAVAPEIISEPPQSAAEYLRRLRAVRSQPSTQRQIT